MKVVMDNEVKINEAATKAMAFELVLAKKALIKEWAKALRKSHKVSVASSVWIATERYKQEIDQND